MDKIFVRNLSLLAAILMLCSGALCYVLIKGEKSLDRTGDMVVHTYEVITTAEQLSAVVEGMLAAQRGYVISVNPDFLKEYQEKKAHLNELITRLSELCADNLATTGLIAEIKNYIVVFTDKLEARALQIPLQGSSVITSDSLEYITAINEARINIRLLNDKILETEYNLLTKRINILEEKKHQYFSSLLTGGLAGVALILIFNGVLFQIQSRRSRTENLLHESEQRFALAIEGSNDGIFDYDLRTGKIFYSKQFFGMLGYPERGAFTGSRDDAMMLIHPDDVETVTTHLNQYLNGEISEYFNTFRMRHRDGHWVWITSRAKAIFSPEGKPLRMLGSHTDISYLKDSEERLKQEKEAAEQANRAKSDFLAHMSHEIRTPLTAISGVAEILDISSGDFDLKKQKLIKALWTSTSSLKDLINDILDFSKIESGELELNETSFLLEDLFEQVISIMSVKAQEKKLRFVFDYSGLKGVSFLGDATRLRQILINLIGNGLKFSDQGGVNVKATSDLYNQSPILHIEVSDTGIGIPPEKFDLIFERFKQADSSVSRKYGGTGLGLPISKNLALMMGGDIHLTSQPGQGSTFTLLLPFKSPHEDSLVPQPVDLNIANALTDQIRQSSTGENRVLLVEDYEGNILVIGYLLDDLGLLYDIARTGLEALSLWRQTRYDLILMDVQMPEMDGLTASSTIRAIEVEKNWNRIPIIGMTAHALIADKDKCIQAGMDAYLPKPIIEAELKTQILKFLNRKTA